MVRVIPIEVIASWPQSNFEDPQLRGPGLIVLASVSIALVTAFVLLRLYVRIFMLRWFAADDVFIVLAFLSVCGMTTCVITAFMHYGWDRHIWDLPFKRYNDSLILAWWTKIVFSTAACFTRLSLLMFYHRLTRESTKRLYKLCILFATVVSVVVGVALILFTILQCSPVRAFWTWPPLPNQRCIDEGMLTLYCGVANNVADLLVVALPIPLIAKLQLPLRQRVGAIILVSLGLVVCVAGAFRTYYTWYALIKTYDYPWNGFGIYVSAMIEVDLGVICACAPALRVYFTKVVHPRFAQVIKFLAMKSKSNLTPLHADNNDQSSTGSMSRLKSREEMQLAAMYAYHPSLIPSPANEVVVEEKPPSFNNTETLAPPPTDAQVIRANLRRANIIPFQPRKRHRGHRRRHSAYETLPALDEHSTDFDLSKGTRRLSLTPHIANSGIPRAHIVDQLGSRRRHSSVVDLNRFAFLESPTVQERPSLSVASSDIESLPIFTQSPEKSPESVSTSSFRSRSNTLRIPGRTLKNARGLLFDANASVSSPTRLVAWPMQSEKPRKKEPNGIDFFDGASIDNTSASPVTRYIKQQHNLLQSAIAQDQERARLSLERSSSNAR